MSITPWSPWRFNSQISTLKDEMNRLFEGLSPTSSESFPLIPNVEVSEEENNFLVTAELPGVKREDLEIMVRGDQLEIRGHKRDENTQTSGHSYVRERCYGQFLRRITLPSEVDSEQCEAKLNNGVLELRLGKNKQDEKGNKIEVS